MSSLPTTVTAAHGGYATTYRDQINVHGLTKHTLEYDRTSRLGVTSLLEYMSFGN